MTSIAPESRTLTPKGRRTREAILAAAARLMHESGVAGTTVDDVKAEARVSGSQLYHYFEDKEALVRAVVERQATCTVDLQREADLRTPAGVQAWVDAIVARAAEAGGRGGCPLGSLGGQVAEADPWARTRMASGFDDWDALLRDGLDHLRAGGHVAAGIDPARLATAVLATLQGGLLLAQVHRDVSPLRTALTTVITLAVPPAAPSREPVGPRA